MFEGYLQSIDTHILYSCMHSVAIVGPSCNQRSISTSENETFFGVLEEIGATKLGYPKATEIGRSMAAVAELMHIRQHPDSRWGYKSYFL